MGTIVKGQASERMRRLCAGTPVHYERTARSSRKENDCKRPWVKAEGIEVHVSPFGATITKVGRCRLTPR